MIVVFGAAAMTTAPGATIVEGGGRTLVDGDPIANIELLADPERNLRVIMKDGKIYKDTR